MGVPDWASVDIAVPRAPIGLTGVAMAGFGQSVPAAVELAMVPHPSVTLLFDLSDGDGLVCRSGDRPERGSVVVGLFPGDVRVAGRVGQCLQIRLAPITAAAVLGTPEINGMTVPLADVWGRDAERFEGRLRAAQTWDERFAVAATILRQRLADQSIEPEVAYVWQQTRSTSGQVRIEGLADEIGWSRTRLWSRFRAQLGVTPKRAARLVRFDHAAHLLAAGHSPARVAADCGYVDQSHLSRETAAIAGMTPTVVAGAPWLAIDDVAWPHHVAQACAAG
jgi:AraC-like DNA-binding protein